MTYALPNALHDSITLPGLPSWVTAARGETLEDVAFLSGAALAHLNVVLRRQELPLSLLRDAVHLLRPGDLPGPAGEIYLCWRRGVARSVSVKALHRAFSDTDPDRIAAWPDAGQGAPVARAAMVLETVLATPPRGEVAALILADATLAQALGWEHLLPLLAAGLKPGDLRQRGVELRLACHRAVTASAIEAVRLAADLARRTARLQAVAPKLRAKRAGAALEIFRSQDAVAASALPLPDRAARRLCDQLVELGVLRELTGRDSFRLTSQPETQIIHMLGKGHQGIPPLSRHVPLSSTFTV